jgi:hypothetical protein
MCLALGKAEGDDLRRVMAARNDSLVVVEARNRLPQRQENQLDLAAGRSGRDVAGFSMSTKIRCRSVFEEAVCSSLIEQLSFTRTHSRSHVHNLSPQ